MTEEQLKDLNNFRRECGLPPIVPGVVKCLRCRREFKSRDKKKNRLCDNCRETINRASRSTDEIREVAYVD